MNDLSIIPSSGEFGLEWPSHHNLPQGLGGSLSMAGWTSGNEGFVQQTFLGASIRSFDLNAGFGETTSTMSIGLVNDDYNVSDGTKAGRGDDPYHSGLHDRFAPPVVGTPVFFKFGKNLADVEQAWRKTLDDTYGYDTIPNYDFDIVETSGDITEIPGDNHFFLETVSGIHKWEDRSVLLDSGNLGRGSGHFVFGGILQSYVENRGLDGAPLYNVTVSDPREILSNTVLVLNNYAGTTYNNKNLLNLYGFLEYEPSDDLRSTIEEKSDAKSFLTKHVDSGTADVTYTGRIISSHTSRNASPNVKVSGDISDFGTDVYFFDNQSFKPDNFPQSFPITGAGMSRRSDQGIPVYRVIESLESLFEYNGNIPAEYKNSGFGGPIDFRGYKYVVDFTGLPLDKIPELYYLDFDQIDLLSLSQELCDIVSHDLFVSLHPVVNHPAYNWLYNKNVWNMENGNFSDVITGVIRIDAIDRSFQPEYGSIKSYLDGLESSGVYVENRDIGFEASNVVTDKFVVGAQNVDMYYFHNNKDRDNLQLRRFKNGLDNEYEALQGDQWSHDTALKQQILPFYGFLGKDAVTIPRGFGAYQQIMLDATGLDAFGVGNYYIATEMELRHAAVSYQAWVKFLLMYNSRYMSSVGDGQVLLGSLAEKIETEDEARKIHGFTHGGNPYAGREFAVDVPRCVFTSDRNYMGEDGYPASPCSPPYGYPLYFKRAEKIGIPQAGFTNIVTSRTTLVTDYERAKDLEERYELETSQFDRELADLNRELEKATGDRKKQIQEQIVAKQNERNEANRNLASVNRTRAAVKTTLEGNAHLLKSVDRLGREVSKNALKVYNFLKEIADQYLGKQFLVKIPKYCNLNYDKNLQTADDNTFNIEKGPFGFRPQPVNSQYYYEQSPQFQAEIGLLQGAVNSLSNHRHEHYLDPTPTGYTYGALKTAFNPVSEKWESNYAPEPQGGFFDNGIFDKNLTVAEQEALSGVRLPPATEQHLCPKDNTNLVRENGRIRTYVRYDHSENLDLSSLRNTDFTQQKITTAGMVPDVMGELGNTSKENLQSFDSIQKRIEQMGSNARDKAVAFVACELEPQFYMAPKSESVSTPVFGRKVEPVSHDPTQKLVNYIPDGEECEQVKEVTLYDNVYFLPAFSGGVDGTSVNITEYCKEFDTYASGELVETATPNLDPQHVYAVIRLPGRLIPTADSRYVDGPLQAINTPRLKSALTADVVRGAPGFEKPAPVDNSYDIIQALCIEDDFSAEFLTNTMAAYHRNVKSITLGLPEFNAGFTSPSPVYPDMVALPLMSQDRCYGPWVSSSVQNLPGVSGRRISNIGGKIEFVKDENLAPWNFAGYQLLNEAGALQAQFSNSQLLFTERGGFVMVEAPTGIALAKSLQDKGPLVTSINVQVGESVKTTVKMDLYTAQFGKLQELQKRQISKAARDRQRLIDERNANIRRGMGKNASAANISSVYNQFSGVVNAAKDYDRTLTNYEKGTTTPDRMIFSVVKQEEEGIDRSGESTKVDITGVQASVQDETLAAQARELSPSPREADLSYYNSAGGSLANVFEPYSNEVFHPNMPSQEYRNPQPDLGDF